MLCEVFHPDTQVSEVVKPCDGTLEASESFRDCCSGALPPRTIYLAACNFCRARSRAACTIVVFCSGPPRLSHMRRNGLRFRNKRMF